MENGIQQIIRNSKNISEYDKDIWEAVFENIMDSQAALFSKIRERVEQQMDTVGSDHRVWNIVTALADQADVAAALQNGLFQMIQITSFTPSIPYAQLADRHEQNDPDSVYSAGIAFLKCPYAEVLAYCSKRYKAKVKTEGDEIEVPFVLERYDCYKRIEELLERTARQYGIDRPVIFSPLSRRAVNVKLDFSGITVPQPRSNVIDFQIEKNGLGDVLLCDKTLLWNVEVTEENEIPGPRENTDKKIVSLFEKEYAIYEFAAEKNEFIYFSSPISEVKRYENRVYVNLNEKQTIEDIRYSKLAIMDVTSVFLEGLEYRYQNFYHNTGKRERIRTQADIDYVLHKFRNDMARYVGLVRNCEGVNTVHAYEKGDVYHYTKDKIYRSSSVCYIKFEVSGSWIAEDAINYMIAFLNFYYPEYYWVGVV